jgi:hypothetical protein
MIKFMKVAVHNEFFGKYVAETELARRICLAGAKLGWEVIEVGSSNEIESFNPDFVIALHFKTPKVTNFPTYGCMWNPVIFLKQWEGGEKSIRNILSYDGYLSSSDRIDTWLNDLVSETDKLYFICPEFYTSCHQIEYQQPQIANPHLVYIGTNWDGSRYQEIFKGLDRQSYMEVYGPQKAWKYLRSSYKGSLKFDGMSLISTLNRAGIGLCLHKKEHLDEAVPSMRIFEIVASGALAICQRHSFIEKAFGDMVLYIDSNLSPQAQISQISTHVEWVAENQQKALDMSMAAHQVFMDKYSLENLLSNIVPYHQKLIANKDFNPSDSVINYSQDTVDDKHTKLQLKFISLIVRSIKNKIASRIR